MGEHINNGIFAFACRPHPTYMPTSGCHQCPPVSIQITVPPDKLIYQDGEDIDLTGIVVRAFKANGNLWGGFPHGIIPIDQLTYEPTSISNVYVCEVDGVEFQWAKNCYGIHHVDKQFYVTDVVGDDVRIFIDEIGTNWIEIYFVSKTNYADYKLMFQQPGGSWDTFTTKQSPQTINVDGTTYYLFHAPNISDLVSCNISEPAPLTYYNKANVIRAIYGTAPSDNIVTVSWDYQGNIMTDTFEVTVG